MTRDEFIKKWNPNAVVCPSFMDKDLAALIESEIQEAGKKPPFERPFLTIELASNVKPNYQVWDANHKVASSWLEKSEAEYLCQLLNRE